MKPVGLVSRSSTLERKDATIGWGNPLSTGANTVSVYL